VSCLQQLRIFVRDHAPARYRSRLAIGRLYRLRRGSAAPVVAGAGDGTTVADLACVGGVAGVGGLAAVSDCNVTVRSKSARSKTAAAQSICLLLTVRWPSMAL
jgi:hypothetical protein